MSEASVDEKKGPKGTPCNLEIGVHEGLIMIDFRKEVEMIGLPPERAVKMAAVLVQAALEASGGNLKLPEPLASMVTGPTGNFSKGKLSKDDAGDINIKVNVAGELVKVEFGYPVAWLGLTADNATDLGNLLTANAKVIKSVSALN